MRFGNLGNAAYICTMFINKSRNKSGMTSVRVLEKRGRNNVLVKSMGSSRDEKEIERMVEQAKAFIKLRTALSYEQDRLTDTTNVS